MPSKLHEALLLLFRNKPELLLWLLKRLRKKVPSYKRIRLYDQNVTPDTSKPHFGDLVVVLENRKDKAVYTIVTESQLKPDAKKHKSWPVYCATLHRELGGQVALLVVTNAEATAKWARKPIKTFCHGSAMRPFVAGPKQVPKLVSSKRKIEMEEIAVLSAIVHGNARNGAQVVIKALERIAKMLDQERKEKYTHYVLSSLKLKRLKEVEALMHKNPEPFISNYAKDLLSRGEAKGRTEGEARALLKILKLRGLTVTKAQENTILQCTDLSKLEVWLNASLSVLSLDALLVL